MKRRKYQSTSEAVFLLVLVLSGTFSAGLARELPPKQQPLRSLQRIEKRQAGGDFGLQTILELGLKYVPVLFNAFFGGGGGAQQQTTDRIEELDLKASSFLYLAYWAHPKKQSIADLLYFLPFNLILQEEDPFAWPTLLSMGIKIALALFTSATSGGIDKADVSPTQAILGTVISALTGSEDPSEVALMAKQASEVINMLVTLVEALGTSFSSWKDRN
jgi:hypothetical protein